jgi:hypothetical protein
VHGAQPREEVSTGGALREILKTLSKINAVKNRKHGRYVMARHNMVFLSFLVVVAVLLSGVAVQAEQPQNHNRPMVDIPDGWTRTEVTTFLKNSKAQVELADASIIIEVNSTDGDAGFQVFLDGDGWSKARVYDPNGYRILKVSATGGVRHIGGGTELFMETAEPEYENLEGMEDLIELLPEGEYLFVARTTDNSWAIGTAELTHDVPAGPEIVYPPVVEDECSPDVPVGTAYIEWDPVETDIWGGMDIEIEAYQVIVESEAEDGPDFEFMAVVPAETTMVTIPPEALAEGTEFKFEILAIEESGNQTITESCFETME